MSAMPTPATAPRDLAELSAQGVFLHRRLAESLQDLGHIVWASERDKATFLTAPAASRAEVLLVHLKAYDAAQGGAPAAAEAIPAPAVPAAPAVDPAAAPPPEAATSSKRAPKTNTAAPAAAAAQAPALPGAIGQDVILALKALTEQMTQQGKVIEALQKSVGINFSSLNDLKANTAAMMKVQQVELGLLTLFGAQVLGAPMDDFMGAACEDANKALTVIENLGKD